MEPLQGENGVIEAPECYLGWPASCADEHGALLWFDEVQTGLGRTGAWLASAARGVQGDLITLAKGLGSGFPVGACVAVGPAAELMQPGQHGTTFGGNPLASRAALTVLDVIESDGLLEHAHRDGRGSPGRSRGSACPRSTMCGAGGCCSASS